MHLTWPSRRSVVFRSIRVEAPYPKYYHSDQGSDVGSPAVCAVKSGLILGSIPVLRTWE